ncbi:alpha-L-rhamnosidase [Paenibacillus mendelii]|uniref:alpha-L-rhamnosidase n=1 Tax=Paenibacillus mendelii TaxID=206163 RepID=A0ABV6J2E1_9BACL|nr:alpha-L-rhamnosidase [Paenibacillus mendelii]MCQ6562843.1 glycoside hydrolase family 78 protein [Paenibacillus mendelii]
MLTIEALTVDYVQNPIGIDTREPGLGWMLHAEGGARGCHQTAYRIIVASRLELIDQQTGVVWDTGRVESAQSQHIIYAGHELDSCTRYYWKVKIWDQSGEESGWSDPAYWETGFMEDSEWQGSWITASFLKDPFPEPDLLSGIPVIWDADDEASNAESSVSQGGASGRGAAKRYFRLAFPLAEEWTEAKLHIYAADSNYIYVNGQSEGLYFPYEQTVTLDIAELLQLGDNVVACSSDGEKKGFIAVLHLTQSDGRTLQYSTEAPEWKVLDRYEDGWNQAGYRDDHWHAPVQIGRFGHEEWARYKRIVYPVNKGYGPNPRFGKSFKVRSGVSQARLYISSLGIYQCQLNDEPVSRDAFAPGWTDYRNRIPYQTYDVTGSLQEGNNRLEATVGSGWYAGLLGIFGPYHYGAKVACRAELHIAYLDGSTEIHYTDEDWQTAESPVVSADFFMGETYDARLELAPPAWRNAVLLDTVPGGRMTAAVGPAIRPTRKLIPVSIKRIGASIYQLDMGQNMVGRIRLGVSGRQGSQVRIRYAERLTPEGRLYTANLRSAKQADTYILNGTADEAYEPAFTYHGFQYIEIEGYHGELTIDKVTGIVIHSDLEEVGEMKTSHPLVNRLLDNIRWSQRGNFIGLPLDCPQRDERLGWTGDAHAFARTATYNMNSAGFYTKWLTDIRDAQRGDGAYPNVAPDVRDLGAGFVFFGDGGVIIPWTMYQVYGDKRFIEANYASMKKWIEYLLSDCDEQLVRRTETFGDHLAYGAETPKGLINAAFFAYSVKLMAAMAGAIGAERDAEEYSDLFIRLKDSFQKRHVLEDGSVVSGTQTAYVLALMIGLLPEATIPAAVSRLKDEIERNDWHLTTGFMGVSYILAALSEHGEQETALRLLLQESFPSWLYPVRNGATTMWERWDGWNEERGFQDPEMNSFNHYALGSVGEWLYRYLAGIDLAEGASGFQRFLIRPIMGGGFTHVACRFKSLYGFIGSEWRQDVNVGTMNVGIPVNTTAEIVVPAKPGDTVMIDGRSIGASQEQTEFETEALKEAGSGWTVLKRSSDALHIHAGSGQYQIKVYKGDNS